MVWRRWIWQAVVPFAVSRQSRGAGPIARSASVALGTMLARSCAGHAPTAMEPRLALPRTHRKLAHPRPGGS